MTTVTVSSKYQIVIPREVRERHKIKPGQKMVVLDKGQTIALVPALEIEDLFGIAPGINLDDIRDERDRV